MIIKPIILFFALLSPAFGRIGETTKECQKRYDCDKLPAPNGELSAVKGDLLLAAKFREGKCVVIVYSKIKNDFSPDEIIKLMDANHSGKWVKAESSDPSTLTRISADCSVVFTYNTKTKEIMFITADEVASRLKEASEESDRTMKGL